MYSMQDHSTTLPLLTAAIRTAHSAHSAMLQDLQKTHKQFRNLEVLVLGLIREEFGKKGGK
jgi:hypothetical protein